MCVFKAVCLARGDSKSMPVWKHHLVLCVRAVQNALAGWWVSIITVIIYDSHSLSLSFSFAGAVCRGNCMSESRYGDHSMDKSTLVLILQHIHTHTSCHLSSKQWAFFGSSNESVVKGITFIKKDMLYLE